MSSKNTLLRAAARRILRSYLNLQPHENLVVVTDLALEPVGRLFLAAGKDLRNEVTLVVIGETGRNGAEPPAAAAAAMLNADVVVCPTKFSLSHTAARAAATANGARIATMPGITEEMLLEGPITANAKRLNARTTHVQERLSDAETVRIGTSGHILEFSVRGRDARASTGFFVLPGSWGNLPSGEAYVAPVEGSASGQLLVNGSIAVIGRVSAPVLLHFSQGILVKANGADGRRLRSMLGPSEEARNVAEFGVGTNDRARVTGVILQDEKAFGTIHIGLGDNAGFGGLTKAGVHMDVVTAGPDVWFDSTQIMTSGRLLL